MDFLLWNYCQGMGSILAHAENYLCYCCKQQFDLNYGLELEFIHHLQTKQILFYSAVGNHLCCKHVLTIMSRLTDCVTAHTRTHFHATHLPTTFKKTLHKSFNEIFICKHNQHQTSMIWLSMTTAHQQLTVDRVTHLLSKPKLVNHDIICDGHLFIYAHM